MPKTRELKLRELLHRLMALRLTRRTPPGCELPPGAIGILLWVARSPGCGVLELAEAMRVKPPSISVGVRRLVRDGWLERRQDPKDRRAKPLYLTDKGEALVVQMHTYHDEVMRLFLSGLQPEEQDQFLNLFNRAVTAMEKTLSEEA